MFALSQLSGLTNSHEIIYPVWDREDKNQTLSSGTSPYMLYKGISPPGGGGREIYVSLKTIFFRNELERESP